MRPVTALPLGPGLGLVIALATSCAAPRPGPVANPSAPVAELNLLAMSTALNLDARPGADGVYVKVFAVRRGAAKASALRTGVLEIHAFDGTLDPTHRTEAFRTWRFTPEQLRTHQFSATLGVGYNLLLDWSPATLSGDRVTVIAQYLPPEGPPVTSEPGYVAAVTL